jgi:hypothetical protein
MHRSPYRAIGILVILAAFLAPGVAAVSVTESPDNVQKGDQITLTISDLADGSSFSLEIGGKFAVTPGASFSFITRSFNMPFSLNKGTVSATTQGTRTTAFSVQKGDSIVQVGSAADSSGYFTISKEYDIGSGVYDYLMLTGKARTDTSVISSSMNLIGTKKGPSSSVITFTIDGIDNGEVYLTALVDGNQVLFKKVTVGNGISSPTPVETTEPVTTEPVETETTPEEGETVEETTTTTYASGVTGTATTAVAGTTKAPVSSFSSADRVVKLTGEGIEYAAILMVSEVNPPADWVMVTDAYKIAPESLVFSTPVTLSFKVPSTAGDYAYFIAELKDDEWIVVSSSAGDDTIDTETDHVGTFALMGYKPESTLPATTSGGNSQVTDATTSAVTAKGTLRVASIAQEQQTAAPATTKPSPLDPLPVIGALAICSLALFVIRKQQ